MKDEGAQIFYSIWSQTKPIGIGVNCEMLTVVKLQILEFWYQKDLYNEETSYQERVGQVEYHETSQSDQAVSLWLKIANYGENV